MLQALNEAYLQINSLSKSNPVLAGIISLWGLGIITFLFRNVPSAIFKKVFKQLTTELTINNNDKIYYQFLEWISKNKTNFFVRDYNINNSDKWGDGDAKLSIGYGKIWFTFKRRVIFMERSKDQANQSQHVKETVTITLFGRKSELFRDLFKLIQNENSKEKDKYIKIYKWKDDFWNSTENQLKRSLDTVIISKDCKKSILNHVDTFFKDKNWCLKNGIPWRTGILLQGPPGTGKTSLIKGLCSHYNKDLYILDLARVTDEKLQEALTSIPENSIVAIEDIDCAGIKKRAAGNKSEAKFGEGKELSFLSLSGVLNALDGVSSGEGRIVIATTNFPEKLDEALTRDGRFDLKVDIGNLTQETFKEYMVRFYPKLNLDDWEILPNIAPSKLQTLVIKNKTNPKEILKSIAKKKNQTVINLRNANV